MNPFQLRHFMYNGHDWGCILLASKHNIHIIIGLKPNMHAIIVHASTRENKILYTFHNTSHPIGVF